MSKTIVIQAGSTNTISINAPAAQKVKVTCPVKRTIEVCPKFQINVTNTEQVSEILYNNSDPTPEDVGGISSGSTFVDQTMQQMWDALLYPYQDPSWTLFDFQPSQGTYLEVGSRTPNNPTFKWSATNNSNIADGSVDIIDTETSPDTTVSSGNDYSDTPLQVTYGPVGLNAPGDYVFKIVGEDTEGDEFSRNLTLRFRFRTYVGASTETSLTENEIESLAFSGIGQEAGTYTVAALTGGYKYFAFAEYSGSFEPESFVLQASNTEIPMAGSADGYDRTNSNGVTYKRVSVENSYGIIENYALYRSFNALGAQTAIIVS